VLRAVVGAVFALGGAGAFSASETHLVLAGAGSGAVGVAQHLAWARARLGLYPIVTLEKQLLNMIGKLV
jgi:hypothetical protein